MKSTILSIFLLVTEILAHNPHGATISNITTAATKSGEAVSNVTVTESNVASSVVVNGTSLVANISAHDATLMNTTALTGIRQALNNLGIQDPSAINMTQLTNATKNADRNDAEQFLFTGFDYLKTTEAKNITVTGWIGTLLVNTNTSVSIRIPGWVGNLVVASNVSRLHVTGWIGNFQAKFVRRVYIRGFIDTFNSSTSPRVRRQLLNNTFGGGVIMHKPNLTNI